MFNLQNDIPEGYEEDLSDDDVQPEYPMGVGPDNIPLRRNVANFLSSFWICKVAYAFTDVKAYSGTEKSRTEVMK
jgi:hypothetical protein